MSITIPERISFYDWACDLNRTAPRLTIPIPTKDDNEWWDWAQNFIFINNLSGIVVPDKKTFPKKEDWKKWAFFLIRNANITI